MRPYIPPVRQASEAPRAEGLSKGSLSLSEVSLGVPEALRPLQHLLERTDGISLKDRNNVNNKTIYKLKSNIGLYKPQGNQAREPLTI